MTGGPTAAEAVLVFRVLLLCVRVFGGWWGLGSLRDDVLLLRDMLLKRGERGESTCKQNSEAVHGFNWMINKQNA